MRPFALALAALAAAAAALVTPRVETARAAEGSPPPPVEVIEVRPAAPRVAPKPPIAPKTTAERKKSAAPRKAETAAPEPAGFATAEELLGFIYAYRDEPQPERLPQAVAAMSRLGLLRDMDAAGLYVGFTAGVLGANAAAADDLVARLFPRPPEEQGLVVKAISYSGLADWKGVLGRVVERMPARRKQIEKQLYGEAETLETLKLETGPAPVDTLWGHYFATGSFEPVARIVTALEWASDKSNLDRLTVGGMAKWTLASNAMRDKALLDWLREAGAGRPKALQKELREVVVAAESFEVTKIRRDALAAIDDVRRRGPQASFWSTATAINAAPTVIGLACVAASVAGQVALGIPCVVSGALSTAVAKHFGQP